MSVNVGVPSNLCESGSVSACVSECICVTVSVCESMSLSECVCLSASVSECVCVCASVSECVCVSMSEYVLSHGHLAVGLLVLDPGGLVLKWAVLDSGNPAGAS